MTDDDRIAELEARVASLEAAVTELTSAAAQPAEPAPAAAVAPPPLCRWGQSRSNAANSIGRARPGWSRRQSQRHANCITASL